MATSFHGFLVKEKIGSGGMSTVYKGFHETLGYPVAIKVLHPGMAGDKSFIMRFEREAKAASALRNNNIASVIDFGSEDDIYFIVMEFVEGEDLGQILSKVQEECAEHCALPLEIVLSLLEEVAYGLKDAHEQGIIHRDIKPTNILLHKRGEVKIADFGLARDTGDVNTMSSLDLTVPGTVVGTPSFMSPEQAAGRELDTRTDIFSLGVMAYQLLMGEKPFQGATAVEVQEAIITQDPPALTTERCPLLTPEVEALVTKMLAKDPNRRFQNMDQLLRSLSECMERVDSSGSLIRFKRDYLNKFAQDPVSFSEELRKKGINNHLKQGYHFQKMGLSNIDDAIREFSYVLSLDPQNEKAESAIAELMKNAEESGIVPAYKGPQAFDAGVTQVLATSTPAPKTPAKDEAEQSKPKPPKPPEPPKPPKAPGAAKGLNPMVLYGGGAAAVLLIILVVVFWPKGEGTPDEIEPQVAEATVEETDSTPVREQPASNPADSGPGEETVDLNTATPPVPVPEHPEGETPDQTVTEGGSEQETPVEQEPEPVVQPVGTLRITSEPAGAIVYLKTQNASSFNRVGTTPHTTAELAVGQWEIRLEKSGFVGKSKVYGVRDGMERPLSFSLTPVQGPSTDPGFFRLVAIPYGDVFLDGTLQAESKKLVYVSAAPREAHELRIHHSATVGDIVLSGMKVDSGDTIDLGRQIFNVGQLKVAANTQIKILVDGVELEGNTPIDESRVLIGDHLITPQKPGLVVDKAWLFGANGKQEMSPVDPSAAIPQYRISVKKDETLRVKFDMKSAN